MNNRWMDFAKGRFLQVCTAILLLAALAHWPYSYYEFVRLAVSLAGAILAWQFFQAKRFSWAIAMTGLVLLFNPIIPIHFYRQDWAWIDVASALIFLACPPPKSKVLT